MTKAVFIFRHGETDWNVAERFQGHIDISLNERGREQAKMLIPLLKSAEIEAVLSSDLSRAKETGSIVASALKIPVHEDVRLREAHLGDAQGRTREEIEKHFGEELARRWRSSHLLDADIAYPGGESGNSVMKRGFAALEEFLMNNPYDRIGVATHGGVIRRIMQAILPPGSPAVAIPNGVLYELEFKEHVANNSNANRWQLKK